MSKTTTHVRHYPTAGFISQMLHAVELPVVHSSARCGVYAITATIESRTTKCPSNVLPGCAVGDCKQGIETICVTSSTKIWTKSPMTWSK